MSGAVIKIMDLFRMPLYFVLSGLFFKTYDGFFPFLKKKFNKLLIPFMFVYFVLVLPTIFLISWKQGIPLSLSRVFIEDNGKLNLGIDGAMWFLICLYFVNLFLNVIFILSKGNIIYISLFSFLCGVLGYILNYYNIYLYIWIDTALTALPFFLFGFLIRRFSLILNENFTQRDKVIFWVSSAVLVMVYVCNKLMGGEIIIYARNEFSINISLLYLGGITGTMSILMIAKKFRCLPIISYIGRYSVIVLLTHLPLLFVIRNLLYKIGIQQSDQLFLNIFIFIFIVLLSLPIVKVCIRFLPYFFAQKDLWK